MVSAPQHSDESSQHDHAGTKLDRSCGQRGGVSGVCIQTLAISCTMIVSLQFEEPDLHREFHLQDVTDGMP